MRSLCRLGLIIFMISLSGFRAWAAEPLQLAFLRAYPQPAAEADDNPKKALPEKENPAHRALDRNNLYDPSNPDLPRLQNHDEAMRNIPRDPNGFPDWMRALREGNIKPKTGLLPGAAMGILELDVIMKNTKEMPNVRFPHSSHTMWLDCSNCHPKPFEARAGSTKIAMADIFRGQYCGMCHDRVAFITFFACQRCHSVPQSRDGASPR